MKRTQTIWKHQLRLIDTQILSVPRGSEFLCVHEQHGEIHIWWRCDPSNPPVDLTIHVNGTGHMVAKHSVYVGTAFIDQFVWHVFVAERQAP